MSRVDVRSQASVNRRRRRGGVLVTILVTISLTLAGCGTSDSNGASPTPDGLGGQPESDRAIVIGNVDASNPARKIEEFQPLADYLAANLESFGIAEGRVVIARDTAELVRMLEAEEVDLYIDAAIPSLDVCELAGCEFVLRQWKGGGPDLAGVFVTTESSGIASIEDLLGKVIMLEQPHSTVGHILPLVTIIEHGIKVRQVNNPQASVADDEVGYYVATGGQSSMNLLLNGEISALAIGERAMRQFSPDVQAQAVIFDHTVAAPSQLVSARAGLDGDLLSEIVALMLVLDQSDEGLEILDKLRDTQKFDELPDGTAAELAELHESVKLAFQD